MENLNFLPVASTNIQSAAYDAANQCCYVKFANGTYKYENCTPENWRNFEATFQAKDSSGSYFYKNIRPLKTTKI